MSLFLCFSAGYNLRRIGDSEKLYATIALTGNTVHEDYDSVGGDSFGQAKHRPRATAYRRPPETTGRRDEKRREKRDLLSWEGCAPLVVREKRVTHDLCDLQRRRSLRIRSSKKIHPVLRDIKNKEACISIRAIGPWKRSRESTKVADGPFSYSDTENAFPSTSLVFFPVLFDANKSSFLKKHRGSLLRADIWTPDSLCVADEVCVNEERTTSFFPHGEYVFLRYVLNIDH